jgi:DNA modification methylase
VLTSCPENGTVLDPFVGTGTTGMVALTHHCNFIGIEVNPRLIDPLNKRLLAYQNLLKQWMY